MKIQTLPNTDDHPPYIIYIHECYTVVTKRKILNKCFNTYAEAEQFLKQLIELYKLTHHMRDKLKQ